MVSRPDRRPGAGSSAGIFSAVGTFVGRKLAGGMLLRGGRSAARPVVLAAALVASLIASAAVAGCDYERIDIISGYDTYKGQILTHYSTVQATKTGIVLKPGARFAIRTEFVTNHLGQFEVAILSGRGMNVYLRTVPHELDPSRSIAFRYAVDGCQLQLPGEGTVPLPYNAEMGQEFLSFYNEASLLRVNVGCTELYQGRTPVPGTEYTIFETLPESTVEIRSVNFFNTDTE